MDDDSSPYIRILRTGAFWLLFGGLGLWTVYSFVPAGTPGGGFAAVAPAYAQDAGEPAIAVAGATWQTYLPIWLIALSVALLASSSFFSGSEAAFFSIHRVRLRAMGEEASGTSRKVARMMANPGRLLTTILIGNTIVNVLIGILLGTRVESAISVTWGVSEAAAYGLAILVVTAALVLIGEITPKVLAVRTGETFARTVVWPLSAFDELLKPLRNSLLQFTNFLFRITRFAQLRAAPFITDQEFESVFMNESANEAIEEDERLMIRGILKFTDAQIREILVPRPDVVALSREGTVADALESFRENAFSRMPVFDEDLDHICGVVVMKDLLPNITRGETDAKLSDLMRSAFFAPETMTVRQFVTEARQRRAHIAIVVDEYGGTEGIATLHDALEEVVGDIHEENEESTLPYRKLGGDAFHVEGNLPLDELSALLELPFEDTEHETVAGYLMGHFDKILEVGDRLETNGAEFVVEECQGTRVSTLRVRVIDRPDEEGV